MLAIVLRRFSAAATLLLAISLPAFAAEWSSVSPGCSSCAASQSVAMAPMQPVFQPQYRTVPVTSFRPITQTVQRPVTYTEFVNQPYTQYVPVQQPQTRQVQTVQYRNVTEYRTVHRDMGRWVTRYQPLNRPAPFQVDPRRNVAGWFNRTAYSIRNSFTPRMATSRQYVPNVVAQTVPVQRRVAVPVVRNVTQMVTRMVPRTAMRSVPVNRVRYETAQVTQMQPMTAYRSVPIGTTMAWAPSGISTAYAPSAPVVAGTYFPSTVGSAVAGGTSVLGSGLAYEVIDDRAVSTALSPQPDNNFSRSARNESKFDRRKRDNIIDDTDHDRDDFIKRGNEFDTEADRTRARGASESAFGNPNSESLRQPYEEDPPGGAADLPPRSSFSDDGFDDDVPAEEDSALFGNAPGRSVSQQTPVNQPAPSAYKRSQEPAAPSPFDNDDGFGTDPAGEFNPGDLPAFEDGGSASFRRRSKPRTNASLRNGRSAQLVSLKSSDFSRTQTVKSNSKSVSFNGWKPSSKRSPLPKVTGPKLTLLDR